MFKGLFLTPFFYRCLFWWMMKEVGEREKGGMSRGRGVEKGDKGTDVVRFLFFWGGLRR